MIHNRYILSGGEETAGDGTFDLLKEMGIQVYNVMRDSCVLEGSMDEKLRAFAARICKLKDLQKYKVLSKRKLNTTIGTIIRNEAAVEAGIEDGVYPRCFADLEGNR